MKNIFTKFAAASLMLAAVACQHKEMLDGNAQNGTSVERVPLTITATLENGQTKTALQEGGKVYWENGDAMTVLAVGEDGAVTSYKFATADEGEEATFTHVPANETDEKVALAQNYYAVYPHTDAERLPYLLSNYSASWGCSVVDSKLKVYFPSMQKVSLSGAAGLDAYSVGVVAEDGTVALKNLGGLIKINIPVEGIEHVILYGNAGETIVGNAYVTFGEDGLPVISSVDGSNMVRIVPASGKTFAIGEYYINVLPVTFSDGLSIIYTKSDDTWASMRSSGEFIVERSKISPLPTVSNLTFGGKVVDVIAVTDAGGGANPFKEGTKSSAKDGSIHAGKVTEWTHKNTEYVFNIYCTYTFYRSSGAGLNIGKTVGDYLEVPAIEGYALNKVVIRTSVSEKQCCHPVIQNTEGTVIDGCNIWDVNKKAYGIEHIWSFMGCAEQAYRIAATASTDYLSLAQVRLYYADAPEGESSIKPLITSVTTADPDIDPYVGKATFNGSFTAVDYTSSALSCGFEYKKVSENEWTSVTCSPTATEFSYEFTDEAGDEYVYRAWTKVNKTDKTVYGNEVQVNARKLILRLVFDDNYMTREDKYNFLLREWGWGTNVNDEDENLNGKTYNYNYKGIAYPFTFWSYRPSATSGGYALWATTGSKKVYGLSLSYGENLAESQPAWMQMPGPADFKLVEVYATLYENFAGTISASVDDEGNATGDPLATFTRRSSFPLKLEGTAEGTRYYFCTTSNQRPTLRNLTLTYLYVGE